MILFCPFKLSDLFRSVILKLYVKNRTHYKKNILIEHRKLHLCGINPKVSILVLIANICIEERDD